MKTHELKTWPIFFSEVEQGNKTFEIRKNDRGFETGDKLLLREWDPETEEYTGRQLTRVVSYMMDMDNPTYHAEFGLADGFAILAIKPVQ